MIEFAALVPLGFAVGAFGTLVGAGGGFILVPILLFLYPETEASTITSMSLLMVTANALSGSIGYGRQRRIDVRSGLLFAAATLPGAIGGSLLVGAIPRAGFEAIFAIALGGVGLWLLLWRQSTAMRDPVQGRWVIVRTIRDRDGDTYRYTFKGLPAMLFSAGAGFLSSLLGVGGGFIQVPIMTGLLHFPAHIATATSQFVLMFMSVEGVSVHLANGDLGWDINLGRAVLLAVGAVGGAQAGALLARRVPAKIITRLLAVALILVALRLGAGAL